MFTINLIGSNFFIREKGPLPYENIDGEDLLDSTENILYDQTIRLAGQPTKQKYLGYLRRVGFYSKEHRRTFTYLTNNFEIKAKDIALLYKNRWQVVLFFKWINQHLNIQSFWGITENDVRIQIFTSISAYCLVAIVEHDLHLNRCTFEVLRILSISLFDKTPIRELFERANKEEFIQNEYIQFCLDF